MIDLKERLQRFIFVVFLILLVIDVIYRTNPQLSSIPKPFPSQMQNNSNSKLNETLQGTHESPSVEPEPQIKSHPSIQSNEPNLETSNLDPLSSNAFSSNINPDDRGRKSALNVLNIHYCSESSYKKTFETMEDYLSKKYPILLIRGSQYDLDPVRLILSKAITLAQYALYGLVFAGQFLFQQLGMAPPAFYDKIAKNRILVFFLVMFLMGHIHTVVISTGAFEVNLNDQIIYSKIQTGKMPTTEDIDKALSLYGF